MTGYGAGAASAAGTGEGAGVGTGDLGGQGQSGGHDGGQQAGSQAPENWRTMLPAELQEAPQLKDVKDFGSLAKQFIDQQKFLGNSIRIPGEDASPEQKMEFYGKLQKHAAGKLVPMPDPNNAESVQAFWESVGVPADHKSYTIDEGMQVDQAWLDGFKETAKKYGLTKTAFRQFVKDYVDKSNADLEAGKQAQTADLQSLQTEWGMATDARINDIAKLAEVFGLPEDFKNAIKSKAVGSHWLKPLWKIVEHLGGLAGEGREVAIQPGGSVADSPAEIKAKIAEIEANPAFLNRRDPMNASLVKKRFELFEKLNAN